MKRLGARILVITIGAAVMALGLAIERVAAQQGARATGLPAEKALAPITIDYPAEGSIFPPEFIAPTFAWRDASESATVWLIDVAFASGVAGMQVRSPGERLRVGEIDPRCVSDTNEPPKLTPQEAAARSWTPDAKTWAAIKQHSVERPATVTITGYQDNKLEGPVSRGRVTIQTSTDPVGAPIWPPKV